MKRVFNSGSQSTEVEVQTSSKRQQYKKLVVPVRMRSIYWRFFGFPADEKQRILTKDVIICTLCKGEMVYNRNTSNLRTHLRCRHKELITKVEQEEGIKTDSETTPLSKNKNKTIEQGDDYEYSVLDVMKAEETPTTSRKPVKDIPTIVVSEEGNDHNDLANISIIFPNGEELLSYDEDKQAEEDSVEMSDVVINFIAADLVCPEVLDGSGFHRLMSSLSSKTVLVPSVGKIVTEIIPNIYSASREHVHSELISGDVTNLSLSMEEWTSKNEMKYLSIYAHYLRSGSVELATKLLGTVLATGHSTPSEWSLTVEKLLDEWNINFNAISAILVAFSFPELTSYLDSKDVTQVPCMMSLIERMCSDIVFRLPSVTDLLQKSRLAMALARSVQITREDFDSQDEFDEYSSQVFAFDKSDSWLTTYYMLCGLLLRKNKILERTPGASTACSLTSQEWMKLDQLKNVLEPLQSIVTTFFEADKCPIVSLLNPLMWKVSNEVFEAQDEDSAFVTEIKTVMKDYFIQAFAKPSVRDFAVMATSLDPRFKNFAQQNMQEDTKKSLEDSLMTLVKSEGLISYEESPSQEPAVSGTKKTNRLSGMNMLFSDLKVKKRALTAEDITQSEVAIFESVCNASLEECPLQWWESRTNKYPNLFRLARKYLCVPAMILINGSNRTLDRLKFYDKRANLKPEIVDMLLFLHLNNDF